MQIRYKLIISSKNVYREVELHSEAKSVKVGTAIDCDVRMHKELFFETIELSFAKYNGTWYVSCSENLFLDVGDVRKLQTKDLRHGDILAVKYESSNNEALTTEFLIDFDNGQRKYERAIDISGCKSVKIGVSSANDLVLSSSYVKNDSIELINYGNKLSISIRNATYGVYHNGIKAQNGETVKNGDFLSISDFIFYYKDNTIWTEIRDGLTVNALPFSDCPTPNQYPKFNRNTRILPVISTSPISILDPPQMPQKPKNNLLMSLLPALGMLAITVFLRGSMGGGGNFIILSVCTMSIGIVTSVITYFGGLREYRKSSKERIEKYNNYIEKKKSDITQYRLDEKKNLDEKFYTFDRKLDMIRSFSGDLFDRNPGDSDFLDVLIGKGMLPAHRVIDYKAKEQLEVSDPLSTLPEELSHEMRMIEQAPVISAFKESNAVGVIGGNERMYELMKSMLIDICIRQYHKDVKIAMIIPESDAHMIEWTRLLPNIQNDEINARNIACDSDSKNMLFEYFYQLLSRREIAKSTHPHFVVFVFNEGSMKLHPLSRYIEKAGSLGFTFVFFANSKDLLPQGCKQIISLGSDGTTGTIVDAEHSSNIYDFSYDVIPDIDALDVATKLSPVFSEEVSLESSLTKNISLFELLNIMSVDDLDISARWKSSLVHKSMAAPLGVKTKNDIVYLDLHEKFHGPHGLVAGTTGSGKSEILQSYILSMATLFHPYEVSIVIIDFKGGGMVNQFKNLPHLVGAITNIDGKEIDRSLQSIKAELEKRQRLFAVAEVNHIDAYIKKFKSGEVRTPIPHLIIIVDEFAELKAEQPEFMKELISAARIGRSLGVHLILATQKPAGQVNEQIWSNSRFKLCLKVQTKEDSNEVLKSPLAAEIREPGRAYLQVGNNEIFELFQSAYSGAPSQFDNDKIREFSLSEVSVSGKRKPVFQQKKTSSGEANITQLDAIVDYVYNYCRNKRIEKLPNICLPSLPAIIPFVDFKRNIESKEICVPVGIYDYPAGQYQGEAVIDISSGNVIIIGSAQYGKTNLLQALIRGLATQYSPSELTFYILDFGSMVLKTFESLNHVGGVVCSSEDEKLKNLFKMIRTEIATRKERLVSVGVSSFMSYREAGYTDLPQIVLMVDNFTALKELYLQDDDTLLTFSREGLAVGITIVMANAQTAGIGYRYLANFATRIAFFCNDSNEYNSVFDYCKMRPASSAGRCILEIDKKHVECQAYLAFEGYKEIDRVQEMRKFISETNKKGPSSNVKFIPVIPSVLYSKDVEKNFPQLTKKTNNVIIGLDYATVSPCILNLDSLGALAISGRNGMGKSNIIKHIVSSAIRNAAVVPDVYIIDNVDKKLIDLCSLMETIEYTINTSAIDGYIRSLESKLQRRYEALVAGEDIEKKTHILIINNPEAVVTASSNKEILALYKNIVTKYRTVGVSILFGNFENTSISYSAPEIIKMLKESKQFLFFDDLTNLKIIDVPLNKAREFKKPVSPGDAYLIKDNDLFKIKTAKY